MDHPGRASNLLCDANRDAAGERANDALDAFDVHEALGLQSTLIRVRTGVTTHQFNVLTVDAASRINFVHGHLDAVEDRLTEVGQTASKRQQGTDL